MMAAKKRQTSNDKSHVHMKRCNEAQGKARFSNNTNNEEDDALDMERNFALLNKHGPRQISESSEKEEEETSGEESNEATEDEEHDDEEHVTEDVETEQWQTQNTEMPENSHDQRKSRQLGGNDANAEFKRDLSTMSFEELLRLQSKFGTKAYNILTHEAKKKKSNLDPVKRVSKNRPEEISAKKPVSFFRKAGSMKRPILRDPRFDDLSGEFKPVVFRQTYKFINDIRQREAEMVKKKLKKEKSKSKKEELKSLLKRMENQKSNYQRQEQQREKEISYKRKQRALVGDGHRPFYVKKSDKKKLELAEKYNELRKSGKLENFLSKKRKRNAVKDRRKLP